MPRPIPKTKEEKQVENELDELERLIKRSSDYQDRLMRRYRYLCNKHGVPMYDDEGKQITAEYEGK